MVALYVGSLVRAVGKTAVCTGVGKHLLSDGKKVGFFKPILTNGKNPLGEDTDSDVTFMKYVLDLKEPSDYLCPVVSHQGDSISIIKETYAKVSSSKDVIIVEGMCELGSDGRLSEYCHRLVEALDAKVIMVQDYSQEVAHTKFINGYKDLEKHLLGIVLNKVPGIQGEHISSELSAQFGEAGINVLGVLPEDRILFALTVGEVAELIQGRILNWAEKSIELVENIMLGAMCVDPGPDYFGRKVNKAVVVKGDRPDMQMAALETSTACLILTGNIEPIGSVLSRAEDRGVPIIVTGGDTDTTVTSIEEGLGKPKFSQEKKLPRLTEIMTEHFNFQALYRGLGILQH